MEATSSTDLMSFVTSISGGDGVRVEETLGNGYVRLRVSEAERRQAKHDIQCVEDAVIELLRNARDADASHIYVATSKEDSFRRIVVIDDGSGIPSDMHARIFDARVTSKLDSMHVDKWGVHGRGMALYSIRETAREASVLASDIGLGSVICVVFDTLEVKERADQSTWPSVSLKSADELTIKGPINIPRVCVEFAHESRRGCRVYLGSPSQILATIRHGARQRGMRNYTSGGPDTLPFVDRPALAQDARELSKYARVLGLEMSERTAHRIIRGEIKPVPNVLLAACPETHNTSHDEYREASIGVRLTTEERGELAERISSCVQPILDKYYMAPSETPSIRVSKDRLVISIPLMELE